MFISDTLVHVTWCQIVLPVRCKFLLDDQLYKQSRPYTEWAYHNCCMHYMYTNGGGLVHILRVWNGRYPLKIEPRLRREDLREFNCSRCADSIEKTVEFVWFEIACLCMVSDSEHPWLTNRESSFKMATIQRLSFCVSHFYVVTSAVSCMTDVQYTWLLQIQTVIYFGLFPVEWTRTRLSSYNSSLFSNAGSKIYIAHAQYQRAESEAFAWSIRNLRAKNSHAGVRRHTYHASKLGNDRVGLTNWFASVLLKICGSRLHGSMLPTTDKQKSRTELQSEHRHRE